VLGQFSAGRDSRILTNGDMKELDTMEGADKAMINLHTHIVEDLKMERTQHMEILLTKLIRFYVCF